MDENLFEAILSMDAYNRGYNAGLVFGSDPNNSVAIPNVTQIGNYTVYATSTSAFSTGIDQSSGFYAISYIYNGEVIISYRGTASATGALDGWGGGAGSTDTPQSELAFQFYQDVAALPGVTNITLTGHSMGGGLAGLVGAVYGDTANVFESMAYTQAANNLALERALEIASPTTYEVLYQEQAGSVAAAVVATDTALTALSLPTLSYLPNPFAGTPLASETLLDSIYGPVTATSTDPVVNESSITATTIQGQVLDYAENLTGFGAATPTQSLSLGSNVNIGLSTALAVHDSALQVILDYAYTPDENAGTAWVNAGQCTPSGLVRQLRAIS